MADRPDETFWPRTKRTWIICAILIGAFLVICLMVDGLNGLWSALPGMAIGVAIGVFVWLSEAIPRRLFRKRQH